MYTLEIQFYIYRTILIVEKLEKYLKQIMDKIIIYSDKNKRFFQLN